MKMFLSCLALLSLLLSASEITYKGEKIKLAAGETVTLHTEGLKLTEDLVIKANEVNVPTYITVASVDDLPSDVVDGTIAIVEG